MYILKDKITLVVMQENIQKGKGTMDLNMLQLMKTKMVTGCLLEMFHGSKFFCSSAHESVVSSINYLFIRLCFCYYCSMFVSSCKRLRIMKGSEAKGLGCF